MTIGFAAVFRFAWRHWRKQPFSMALLFVGIAGATIAEVSISLAIGGLTDAISGSVDTDDAASKASHAFRWLLYLSGFILLYHTCHKGGDYLWCGVQAKIMSQIYHDAFAKVQRMSSRWHAETFAGKTVRNITRGVWAFDDFGDILYFHLLPASCIVAGVLGILTWRWPWVGAGFMAGVILFVAVSIWLNVAYVSPIRRRAVEADSTVSGVLADAITCNAVVKASASETREDTRLKTQLGTWKHHFIKTWFASIHTSVAQALMLGLMQTALIAAAIWLWAYGNATTGDVAFIMFMTFMVNAYLRDVGMHIRNLQQSVNDLEHVVHYDDAKPEIVSPADARDLIVEHGRIQFDHVHFGYQKQVDGSDFESWLFDGLNVEINAGERVALVGRSGSGKTTFTKLLQRLYDIDEGQILIDDQPINNVTAPSLRQSIALVPQEPILFHRTLAENIAYARPDASLQSIRNAAEKANALAFIEALPQAFDTLVGERGVKLSGGERQRVAIARAILADCPILVLDEATSSLDSLSEQLIQEALDTLMSGRTTIIIAHRLSTIRNVDRILVFEHGHIVQTGKHDQLVEQPGAYRDLYRAQADAFEETI